MLLSGQSDQPTWNMSASSASGSRSSSCRRRLADPPAPALFARLPLGRAMYLTTSTLRIWWRVCHLSNLRVQPSAVACNCIGLHYLRKLRGVQRFTERFTVSVTAADGVADTNAPAATACMLSSMISHLPSK